jgi:hypothetical protein
VAPVTDPPPYPSEPLADYVEQLGLPPDIAVRVPDMTTRVEAVLASFQSQRTSRRFLPGLALAMLALVERVLAHEGVESEAGGIEAYELQTHNPRGAHVNTLNVILGDGDMVRLRPLYTGVQHVIVHELRRYDFPNMPGHATQAWRQHQDLLDGLFAMTPNERRAFLGEAWSTVTALHRFVRRTVADAQPRPFAVILGEFPNTQRGEPAGAVLQGLAFAYYRADSPNVTIETGKVGAGSRRTGRVGDVDGYDGPELILSIEVKDADIVDPQDDTLDGFLANLSEWADATAIVLARSAADGVVEELAKQNVAVLTRERMLDAVLRWDLNKQRLAAREFYYYLDRVQRHSSLTQRFEAFIEDQGIDL